ncbi:hypothetical protein FOA52_008305 [Chlamydomonas sp. UWO 241]|nr:hypothetical protein FOA52_008305 [Chlamydomonas sp. UWO 241]
MDVAVTASGFLGRVVELAVATLYTHSAGDLDGRKAAARPPPSCDPDGRVCRKAAALVSYLLVQRRALGADVAAAAAVPLCAAKLGAGADGSVPGVEGSSGEVAAAAAASDDTYVRQGAASVLLELSRCGPGPWGAVAGCPGLGAAIQAAQQAHAALGAEEREAESEEGELLRSLAAAMAAMPAVPADESDHIELDAHDRSAARNRQPGQGQGKQPTATMEGPAAAAASAPALVLPPGGGGMIMGPKQDLR